MRSARALAKVARLQRQEVAAVILYTGPMVRAPCKCFHLLPPSHPYRAFLSHNLLPPCRSPAVRPHQLPASPIPRRSLRQVPRRKQPLLHHRCRPRQCRPEDIPRRHHPGGHHLLSRPQPPHGAPRRLLPPRRHGPQGLRRVGLPQHHEQQGRRPRLLLRGRRGPRRPHRAHAHRHQNPLLRRRPRRLHPRLLPVPDGVRPPPPPLYPCTCPTLLRSELCACCSCAPHACRRSSTSSLQCASSRSRARSTLR